MPERRTAHTAACSAGSSTTRAPGDRGQPVGHLVRIAAVLHQRAPGVGGEPISAGPTAGGWPGRAARSISSIAEGPRLEQPDHGLQRGVHRGERHQGEPAGGRALHQPQLGRAGHRQGPLRCRRAGAASRARRPRGRPGRSPTPAAAAPRATRRRRAGGPPPARPARGGPRPRVARVPSASVTSSSRTWSRGQPVRDRAGAGRVVGDHPAEGRPAPRGDVGPEEQAVGAARGVQAVEHDAGTDARGAGVRVDLDARRARSSRPPARAPTAWPARLVPRAPHRERHAVVAAGGDGGVQVAGVAGAQARQRAVAGRCSRRHAYSSREAGSSRTSPAAVAAQAARPVRAPSIAGWYGPGETAPRGRKTGRGMRPCGPGAVC